MKKLILPILILAAILILCQAAQATPTPLVSVTISNATVTVPNMPASSYTQPLQNGSITHGALTSTNALSVNVYSTYSSSTTNNRVFLGTWYPSTTNAATETIIGTSFTNPVTYLSFDLITTNAVSVSGSYGQ